jgi:hypothetical protein
MSAPADWLSPHGESYTITYEKAGTVYAQAMPGFTWGTPVRITYPTTPTTK